MQKSAILKDSEGPMRLEKMLTFFTTQPSFSKQCFGFPIALLPFIYPDHPEKTLEEACAQSLLAQVRDDPGLPEQYEKYIKSELEASKTKYKIIESLETKVTEVLRAKQLEPICSDARKILHHVLPESRKDWLATETPKHHTQLPIPTKAGSPVGTKRRMDDDDTRRVRGRITSMSPTPGQPDTGAQSPQGSSKHK
ncbi:hypothetical protein H0H93_002582 [Arthromyces matolae]|nr:hypothetical protein H0H93_002582 [Arthromyces matolae]